MSKPSLESLQWINVKRDPTTGLGSLVALLEVMEGSLRTTRSIDQPLSLLHIDIDQLARLNRNLGQAVVDELISHLSQCIPEVLKDINFNRPVDDTLYRIGGDEFAVLLPNVDVEYAAKIAKSLCENCAQDIEPHATLRVTVSIGVASIPDSAHDLGSLITAADMGVLEAKRNGGNSLHIQRINPENPGETVVASRIINMLARRIVETGSLLEEAQKEAFTDPISGLPNHRALNRFLEREHQRAERYSRCYTLLMVDGDALKLYNDKLGHEAGNEWIRSLSHLLVKQTRATDLVARWFSGDEFVVVLTETDLEHALHTAERIREGVELMGKAMPLDGTVSIGVATYPEDGATIADLLSHADAANAEAKQQGRNRVISYRSIPTS